MNKEPIGLYIFRYITGFAMFAFMAMLYWSSLLIEEDLKFLRSDLSLFKEELTEILVAVKTTKESRSEPRASQQKNLPNMEEQNISSSHPRPHIDSSLPNLLQEDPFYKKTFPELLGKGFIPKGRFQDATIGRPDNLHPFSNWSHVAAWQELCSATVAKMQFGKYETFAPDMAIKVEARKMKNSEAVEFWIHLRDDLYWQPLQQEFFPEGFFLASQFLRKQQVTADDFAFYYDAIMNPHLQEAGAIALRTYYDDLQGIEVIDPLTFVVRWKTHLVDSDSGKRVERIKYMAKSLTGALRPLAGFVYKYFPDGKKIIDEEGSPASYRTDSVWAQNFSNHWARNIIVSCGPWMFDGMTDREIRFKRNPDFYSEYAALAESSVIAFKDSSEGIWIDFKADKLDSYTLPPDQQIELVTL
jgi:peptide/nickel transport system substrate-binding protein